MISYILLRVFKNARDEKIRPWACISYLGRNSIWRKSKGNTEEEFL